MADSTGLDQLLSAYSGIESQPAPLPTPLTAVGASSVSQGGTAAGSIDAAANPQDDPGKSLRDQASLLLQAAADKANQANQAAPPAYTPPSTSPFETALGLVLGGALNSDSRFTSEGTKALQAFMDAKGQAAQANYQNAVNQHVSALKAAQDGYKMALQQAQPLLDQANQDDTASQQSAKLKAQQDWQEREAQEKQAASKAEDELKLAHQQGLADLNAKSKSDQDRQEFGERMQEMLSGVLAQTGPGRALLASQIGQILGWTPDQTREYARVMVLQTPAEAAAKAKQFLPMNIAKADLPK